MAEFENSMSDDELLALVEESELDQRTDEIAKESWPLTDQDKRNSDQTQHDETNFDSMQHTKITFFINSLFILPHFLLE